MTLDWKEYESTARQAVAEGLVLLKNENSALPVEKGAKVALFGRMQAHYYKSGTGSGGMVNVPKVWGILDALKLEDITLNETLLQEYEKFEEENPVASDNGFGNGSWSQEEMPVSDELVAKAASDSDIAIVIIARTAGEEQDNVDKPGAYRLSDTEADMLRKVRSVFGRMVVVLNVGAVMDMNVIDEVAPDAILYAWQGGEVGGLGTADVIMGRTSPCGHLADSIVKDIAKASAAGGFGDLDRNFYIEDVYVGYRYYRTFDRDAVAYPFGYGLTFTKFEITDPALTVNGSLTKDAAKDAAFILSAKVKNTGDFKAKEVVQVYVSAPQGSLGQPVLKLAGFAKTEALAPGESESVSIDINAYTIASYDDSGVTGFKNAYVLEAGKYKFYVGENSEDVTLAGEFEIPETAVIEQLSAQMVPASGFDRVRPKEAKATDKAGLPEYEKCTEAVPIAPLKDAEEAKADRPECKPYTGDQGIKLSDVRSGKADMEDFLAQLSDEDLSAIIRGEGMGSPKVTVGTAAAFGGVSPALKDFGIPCGCCSDGPSGMRLDSGARAFSLPNGTLLACTWNTELNEKLYAYLGQEMSYNGVDFLLGPGMNIHRHPLNGRNFEYFSEDPLLTGRMAAAQLRGMHKSGVSGTLKHFCGNNQETHRHTEENVISERALREIYLKGFEIAVREGAADSIMSTYGPVNGIWTSCRHDLLTNILRREWGFKGLVMTDWWTNLGDVGKPVAKNTFSRIVLSQNDFYAVCPDASVNSVNDDTLTALESGVITRGQLIRSARNICNVLMTTNAMRKLVGEKPEVEIINRPEAEEMTDPFDVQYYKIEDGTVIDLSGVDTKPGTTFALGFDIEKRGCYYIELVGGSDLSEFAQIPVAVFYQSVPGGTFTFRGTNGGWMTVERKIAMAARYGVMKLKFMGNRLKLKEMRFTYEKEVDADKIWTDYQDYIIG